MEYISGIILTHLICQKASIVVHTVEVIKLSLSPLDDNRYFFIWWDKYHIMRLVWHSFTGLVVRLLHCYHVVSKIFPWAFIRIHQCFHLSSDIFTFFYLHLVITYYTFILDFTYEWYLLNRLNVLSYKHKHILSLQKMFYFIVFAIIYFNYNHLLISMFIYFL